MRTHSLLGRCPRPRRIRIIGRELLVAYLVLLTFLATGDTVLHDLGLELGRWSDSPGCC
ncbi:MAG: hypothetical protein EOM24_24575 [Chloroflexia bacterium]|nr:hypothetical protein [Chloroflexia bacterium]